MTVISTATGPGTPGPVAAVLTGHTGRVRLFEELLDDVRPVTGLPGPAVSGTSAGVPVLVLGTGMGGAATVRCAHAVVAAGCRVLVRAGGAGPVRDGVGVDDLVVATAAVRHEGASTRFLPTGWPAVADPDVVDALVAAARALGRTPLVGVVHSKDSFYGEVEPDASPVASRLRAQWAAWQRLGVVASEMEAAALFAVATHHGVRAGAVLRINDVAQQSGDVTDAERVLCQVALRGLVGAVQGTDDGSGGGQHLAPAPTSREADHG